MALNFQFKAITDAYCLVSPAPSKTANFVVSVATESEIERKYRALFVSILIVKLILMLKP